MSFHVHAAVGFDADTLGHEEYGLLVPAGHGAPDAVDDTVAGQAEGQRSIVHRTSHEARVVGCQCREPSSFVSHLFRVSSLFKP